VLEKFLVEEEIMMKIKLFPWKLNNENVRVFVEQLLQYFLGGVPGWCHFLIKWTFST
jgi:hypothetical protein